MKIRSQFQKDCYDNLETCLQAWPAVHTECDAAAFPGASSFGGTSSGSGDSDPVSVMLAAAAAATAWMSQWHDWVRTVMPTRPISWSPLAVRQTIAEPFQQVVISTDLAGGWQARRNHQGLHTCVALLHLANRASAYKPRISKGTVLGGLTVGDRTNTTERCAECGDVILCTADDPVKRMDGQPFHYRANPTNQRPACYWQAWRRRQQAATARGA